MFARMLSGTVSGFDGRLVQVEVDVSRGLPMFDIVGLPDTSMRESRERVRAALRNAGFPFPAGRITVNLAPADMPKTGPSSDLAIAVGILAASGHVPTEKLPHYCVVGELSLDGTVHGVPGLLPIALTAAKHRLHLLTSSAAAEEAALVPGLAVVAVENIRQAVDWLRGKPAEPSPGKVVLATSTGVRGFRRPGPHSGARRAEVVGIGAGAAGSDEDLADVKGQTFAKRALEIAAAGDHNLLMVGPPGIGKTMLARRMVGILPPLTADEHLDVARLYSVAGLLDREIIARRQRPFRAPHHAATKAGLLGGARGLPGEVSLAHHGVLFLDELNEFPRALLESLRQPMEDGAIVLARLPKPIRFPARFTLVAAANPCPCGYYGDTGRECRCRLSAVEAYRTKLSGPLADRIDLYVEMAAPSWHELAQTEAPESSAAVAQRVAAARLVQQRRFAGTKFWANGRMDGSALRQFAPLSRRTESVLEHAAQTLHLSARAVHRTVKVARTIADLAGSADITLDHVQEALAFRWPLADSSLAPPQHTHLPSAGGGR